MEDDHSRNLFLTQTSRPTNQPASQSNPTSHPPNQPASQLPILPTSQPTHHPTNRISTLIYCLSDCVCMCIKQQEHFKFCTDLSVLTDIRSGRAELLLKTSLSNNESNLPCGQCLATDNANWAVRQLLQ